jgi:ubiquinol-cytochrome c reductase cytochrome b subunit
MIYGSLLGDSYASKFNNRSTYIVLHQEDSNVQYLMWLYKKLVEAGYCKTDLPTMESRIGPKGKIRYYYRLRTFSYSSFNYIHNDFYPKGIKIVPLEIADYLTPLALAIWICDDGSK